MISSKNIKKALFEIDKNIILVLLTVIAINTSINFLMSVVIFAQRGAVVNIVSQFVFQCIIFGFIYMLSYGVSQSVTATPFLVSLNCPKKLLAKTIIIQGLIRSGIVTFIFLLVKLFIIKPDYLFIDYIFGIDLYSSNIIDIFFIVGVYFILANLVYNLFVYLCLTGLIAGWQCVLASIFVLVGSCFLLFKQIALLFVFGVGFNMFIIILIILSVLLSCINYTCIKNFEYKS